MANPKVVALGGGHGLAATLSALREVTSNVTAIVTVADNGGSSGRLREEFNSLPPGDLRMALAALCGDDQWGRSWAEILQYRFTSSGAMNNHALGNLLLTALWDRDSDPVAGISRVGELLKIVGQVLPMALEPLDIEATFADDAGELQIRGQIQVATAKGAIKELKLIPEHPKPTPQAIKAILEAEYLTFGPGSWFSSVMPHFLMIEQAKAILESNAKKAMIFNLTEEQAAGEYAGNSATEHLQLILRHLPEFRIDLAIVDKSVAKFDSELTNLVEKLGGKLVIDDFMSENGQNHHDISKLASTFAHIFV